MLHHQTANPIHPVVKTNPTYYTDNQPSTVWMNDLALGLARFGHLEGLITDVQELRDIPFEEHQEEHEPLDVCAGRMLADFRSQQTDVSCHEQPRGNI